MGGFGSATEFDEAGYEAPFVAALVNVSGYLANSNEITSVVATEYAAGSAGRRRLQGQRQRRRASGSTTAPTPSPSMSFVSVAFTASIQLDTSNVTIAEQLVASMGGELVDLPTSGPSSFVGQLSRWEV